MSENAGEGNRYSAITNFTSPASIGVVVEYVIMNVDNNNGVSNWLALVYDQGTMFEDINDNNNSG